jgi:hypothetical protein
VRPHGLYTDSVVIDHDSGIDRSQFYGDDGACLWAVVEHAPSANGGELRAQPSGQHRCAGCGAIEAASRERIGTG